MNMFFSCSKEEEIVVMEFDVAWWVSGSSDEAFRTEEQCHSVLPGRSRMLVLWLSGVIAFPVGATGRTDCRRMVR